jgi:hypothetical protein
VPGALNNSFVQLGKHNKVVNLYVPLQFIIGDVEGGDQLCSRQSYRGIACNRLCRTCDISTENCGRTDIECSRIRVADIKQLYLLQDVQALALLAQRPTYNCFYDIDCGKDPYGVFSMIHTEGLHALEVGVMKYMVEILLSELPNKKHRTLDRLIKKMNKYPHQHGYTGFPRCTWSEGVTTLTQLTGDQRVGKMFAILLVALTLDGEKFFTENLDGGHTTWERLVYCFTQVLCYWAWLKQDHYWLATDDAACAAATASIKTMMRQLQNLWPRQDGLKWLLTKLHEQFHVPVDIHRNGKPANVHTGPQEANHIDIKKAAKKTQMQKHKIDLQTGERIVDRIILQRSFDRVKETVYNMDQDLEHAERLDADTGEILNSPQKGDGLVRNATKGTVCISQKLVAQQGHRQGNRRHRNKRTKLPINQVVKWKKTRSGTLTKTILYQNHILDFLRDKYFEEYGVVSNDEKGVSHRTLTMKCFTEYQRNGFVYRCHPLYRKERAYYDWCVVDWKDDNGVTVSYIARIHLFVETPNGEIKAIVQSVAPGTAEDHGVIGTYWYLEHSGPMNNQVPKFELAEVDALRDHVMVIPYNLEGEKRYVHIHDRSEWPGYFMANEPPM